MAFPRFKRISDLTNHKEYLLSGKTILAAPLSCSAAAIGAVRPQTLAQRSKVGRVATGAFPTPALPKAVAEGRAAALPGDWWRSAGLL
jgi:hypothetical protein